MQITVMLILLCLPGAVRKFITFFVYTRCDIIRRSPELSMSVIDALASMCNKKVYRATYPGTRLKTFESQGTWEHWEVPASGWYTVVARNAKGDKPSCVKVYKGFSQKAEGQEAASGAGFYFHLGDEVRAMIGSGASPSCVIVKSHKTEKDQMVLVGGGDVGMALSNGMLIVVLKCCVSSTGEW